jgi:hypothetical protein
VWLWVELMLDAAITMPPFPQGGINDDRRGL